jgi:CheY-like chemotaxis protein
MWIKLRSTTFLLGALLALKCPDAGNLEVNKSSQTNRDKLMMTAAGQLNILLVEDDEVDVINLQRALKKNRVTSPLYRAANGIEALTMLRTNADLTKDPNSKLLILLDLNMPKMGGLEFLKELRSDPALRHLSIVVLTTSRQDSDIATAYEYNVAGYILKPVSFGNFVEKIDVLNRYWSLSEMPSPP